MRRGGRPTEPQGLPQVAGTWNGSWAINSLPVTGTVDDNLKVNWSGPGGGCGPLAGDGTANGLNPTRIVGTGLTLRLLTQGDALG